MLLILIFNNLQLTLLVSLYYSIWIFLFLIFSILIWYYCFILFLCYLIYFLSLIKFIFLEILILICINWMFNLINLISLDLSFQNLRFIIQIIFCKWVLFFLQLNLIFISTFLINIWIQIYITLNLFFFLFRFNLWVNYILFLWIIISIWIFSLSKYLSFEILKCYHDNSYIIKRLSIQTIFQYTFNSQSTLLMHWLSRSIIWIGLPFIFITRIPYTFRHILIRHFIKYSITCKQYKIKTFLYFEFSYFWLRFNHVYISSSICKFCLRITKCPRNWESTWQNSYWTNNIFWLLINYFRL